MKTDYTEFQELLDQQAQARKEEQEQYIQSFQSFQPRTSTGITSHKMFEGFLKAELESNGHMERFRKLVKARDTEGLLALRQELPPCKQRSTLTSILHIIQRNQDNPTWAQQRSA